MPTYEYECRKCKKKFEVFQGIRDEPVKVCKFCNGRVDRLISSGAGIIFKGSGFYATDYRKPSKKDREQKKEPSICPAANAAPSCKDCPRA